MSVNLNDVVVHVPLSYRELDSLVHGFVDVQFEMETKQVLKKYMEQCVLIDQVKSQ